MLKKYESHAYLFEGFADKIEALRKTPIDTELVGYVGDFGYVIEHRSIGLNLPRRSGKTHYIATHARAGDLILTANTYMAEHFQREYGVAAFASRGDRHLCRGCRRRDVTIPARIWVDEPAAFYDLGKVLLNEIVSINQVVISLGTARV